MVWIPPGFNGDNHCIVNSELYVDDPSRFLLMILLKVVHTRWFFQFVFVSTRHSMSISYLILLSKISCSVSPSWSRSSPLGFCNSSHVIPFCFTFCLHIVCYHPQV